MINIADEEKAAKWFGFPSDEMKTYSFDGINYEFFFGTTELEDKTLHVVMSIPKGMPYIAAKENLYLQESKIFEKFVNHLKENDVPKDERPSTLFAYNLFRGKQKSLVFQAYDKKFYKFDFNYDYDTGYSKTELSLLSGEPKNQNEYEKEKSLTKKEKKKNEREKILQKEKLELLYKLDMDILELYSEKSFYLKFRTECHNWGDHCYAEWDEYVEITGKYDYNEYSKSIVFNVENVTSTTKEDIVNKEFPKKFEATNYTWNQKTISIIYILWKNFGDYEGVSKKKQDFLLKS